MLLGEPVPRESDHVGKPCNLDRCMARGLCALQDPREELLKYDEKTKNDPTFLGGAYGATQPEENKLHHRTLEEEEEDFKEEQKKLLES